MENNFIISINGEMKEATSIINFTFNYNTYCVYSVDKDGENVEIYCGKIINHVLYDIEDEKEKAIVNRIVSRLINDDSFETNDENNSTITVQYNGIPTIADVLDIININNEKYLILATTNENTSDIFVRKIIKENEEEKYISIEDEEEKEIVFDIIKNMINQES